MMYLRCTDVISTDDSCWGPGVPRADHSGYPLLLNAQNFTLLSALQLGPTEYAVRVELVGNLQMGNQKGISAWFQYTIRYDDWLVVMDMTGLFFRSVGNDHPN